MSESLPPDREQIADHRFPKRARLRKSIEFDRVYRGGVHAADAMLVVLGTDRGGAAPRLGLAVSKKVGPAVVRNRWKRLIREAFRQSRHAMPALDLVVRPRRGAEPDAVAIRNSLTKLAGRVAHKISKRRST